MHDRLRRVWTLARSWAWVDHVSPLIALLGVAGFWLGSVWLLWLSLGVLLILVVWGQAGTLRWSGRFIGMRLVLLGGILPLALISSQPVLGLITATLAVAVIVVERLARDPLLRIGSVRFGGMRGIVPLTIPTLASRALFVVNTISLLVVWFGWWRGFAEVALAAAAVGVLADALFVAHIGRLRRRRNELIERAFEYVRGYRPEFLLHWDGPANATYQVAMWIPYLQRLKVPFAVVIRNQRAVDEVSQMGDFPVIHCSGEADIDRILVDSISTVFYVNTALKNAHMIRFTHLMHVQLNHGDSDKPGSVSKAFRMFDYNFVAGQAAIDRFRESGMTFDPDQMRIVGRPQVEEITRSSADAADLSVLYAPTWGGYFADSDLSSLPIGREIVQDLLSRGCRVIFRPHPLTDRHAAHLLQKEEIESLLAADAARTGREHVFGADVMAGLTTIDCMNMSDAMVADVSSIITDYLFSEKPVAVVSMDGNEAAIVKDAPITRYTYVLARDTDSRRVTIEQMLGEDPMRSRRLEGRVHCLGGFDVDGYSDVFLRAAHGVLDAARTTHFERS